MNLPEALSQAARCHRLADATHDTRLRAQLLTLAEEYQRLAEQPPAAEDGPLPESAPA